MVLTALDRQALYQQHRRRVLNAKSLVDSQPPQRKFRDDTGKRELSYMEMLLSMEAGLRHRCASLRTFTKSPESVRARNRPKANNPPPCDCWMPDEGYLEPSALSSYRELDSERKKGKMKLDIPEHVLNRFSYLLVSKDMHMMHKLLRPKVYMDLAVKNVRPLGRIVIQLYTEACPEVVLEFVRTCTTQHKERINFTRLFPPLWLEGELALEDNATLNGPNIDHDLNVIDHGSGAGILSFPSRYVRGSKRRSLSFTVSFKPVTVLNGKRIAFGKVRRGYWILDTIQDYGTKNGKPLREIIVTSCGVIR